MKKLFLGICLIAIYIGLPSSAQACECAGGYLSAYAELKYSDSVFIGEVVELKKVNISPAYEGAVPYELEVKFKVKRAWKGVAGKSIILRTEAEGCIVGFAKGKKYLVYASIYKDRLRTSYCSRTKELSRADLDLKEFEEGEKPAKIIETLLP
jgi:hypothetical protein